MYEIVDNCVFWTALIDYWNIVSSCLALTYFTNILLQSSETS